MSSKVLPSRSGFTLLEIIIVIAIVGVVSITAVILIRPAEQLKNARDARRASELGAMNSALVLYEENSGLNSMGSSSVLYVSLPDPAATSSVGTFCETMGLPPLPPGWTYHCAASSTYRLANGAGWIPVNFQNSVSPFGALPVDPVNTTSSSYYTYAVGTDFELTGRFESAKNLPREYKDGGADPVLYEVGADLSVSPFAGGLVGWWSFDEGSGTTAADGSGFGATGSFVGTPTWTQGELGTALQFDGTQGVVSISDSSVSELQLQPPFTISEWLYPTLGGDVTEKSTMNKGWIREDGSNAWVVHNAVLVVGSGFLAYSGVAIPPPLGLGWFKYAFIPSPGDNAWSNLVFLYGSEGRKAYMNGGLQYNQALPLNGYFLKISTTSEPLYIGGVYDGSFSEMWHGSIDDVRVWRRTLTASEAKNVYDAAQ